MGDRPVSARLRPDPLPVFGDAALGRAGRARRGPPRADGRAGDRTGGRRRLRLGRSGRLRRRGALAGPRLGARLRQCVQHPEHRPGDGAGAAGRGSGALVPVLFSQRARSHRPDQGQEGESRVSCGGRGRRPGRSTTRPSTAQPKPSTVPTSSTSSFTPTAIASVWSQATRPTPTSNGASRRSRRSAFRPSPSTGNGTA